MEGTENSNGRVLLEYGYGHVLLGVVRCADRLITDDPENTFVRAQTIAQFQDPELNEMIPRTVMHLQLIADLIEERKALLRDIDRRELARREKGAAADQDSMASEDAVLFERLLELCHKVSQIRKGELQIP